MYLVLSLAQDLSAEDCYSEEAGKRQNDRKASEHRAYDIEATHRSNS